MLLRDICRTFNKHEVKFLIIGGDAAVYYGAEYVSLDYDLWIRGDEDNFKKTVKALVELGYCDNSRFIHGNRYYQRWEAFTLGVMVRFQKKGEKPLDIVLRIQRKTFDSCFRRVNVETTPEGVAMPWVSEKDLVFMKKQAGREKDLLALRQIAEKRTAAPGSAPRTRPH